MRIFASIGIVLLLGCGSKSELLGGGGERGRDAGTPGFVQCGAVSCDIASGNMCYFCQKTEPPRCHTMDLPTECDSPAFLLCDGNEDCDPGERCAESCFNGEPCSFPDRICKN